MTMFVFPMFFIFKVNVFGEHCIYFEYFFVTPDPGTPRSRSVSREPRAGRMPWPCRHCESNVKMLAVNSMNVSASRFLQRLKAPGVRKEDVENGLHLCQWRFSVNNWMVQAFLSCHISSFLTCTDLHNSIGNFARTAEAKKTPSRVCLVGGDLIDLQQSFHFQE